MSWAYDYAGRVKRLTYPHTDTSPIFFVDYAFHSGTGLLHTTTGSDSTVYATMTGYQPNGKIGNMVFGNGATTNYGYDGWSERLTGIYTVADGGLVQDRAYQYTAAGDIEGIDDSYNMESYYYSYDKLHRLRSETTSTGSVGVIPAIMDLAYDDPGHIHAVSQVTTRGQVYDYDYDLNGNQTAGPDLTHPNSGITSFVYDGNAKRAKKVGNGKTTYYYADEFELIDNVETHYVFAGNLRVVQVKNGQTTYFHKDHLGSSTAVTDDSGNVSASTMYMPFGGRRGEGAGIGTTDYLFTDQEFDASTGLYNYDARLYDPAVGQFISPDSIIPKLYDPQALNRFAYARNNPLKYNDPSGHVLVCALLGYSAFNALADLTIITALNYLGHESIKHLRADENPKDEPPVPNAKPERSTSRKKTKIWKKPGDYEKAKEDFDNLNPENVKERDNGTITGNLPDDTNVNVRPRSKDGRPTLELQKGKKRVKVRYGQKPDKTSGAHEKDQKNSQNNNDQGGEQQNGSEDNV